MFWIHPIAASSFLLMLGSDASVKIEMLTGKPFKQFPVRCSLLWLVIFQLYNYMDHENPRVTL